MLSINNFDCFDTSCPKYATRGRLVLPKIKQMLAQIRAQANGTFVKTAAGQRVIMLEGLPSTANLSYQDQLDIINYMNSQQDILWIDNLVTMDLAPDLMASNVFREAAAEPGVQAGLKERWGSRYLWHFSANRVGRSVQAWQDPNFVYPEDVRKWNLNISPHNPDDYPIFISQWNEYGEWLVWEPNMVNGYANYNYLQWRLRMQP